MGFWERRHCAVGAIRLCFRFVERRELIFRSSGRVVYIPLPRTAQLALVVIVAAIGGWVVHASAVYFRNYDLISGKEAQLAVVEERNEALKASMLTMRDRFSDVTGTLERNHRSLVELVEGNAVLQRDLENTRLKLRLSEQRRAEQTKRQVALNRQLMALEADLNKSEQKAGQLAESLEKTKSGLTVAQTDRRAAESTRDWLKLRVKGLEDRLAALKESQQDVVTRLSRRTAGDIDRVQRLFEATGLKLAQFLKKPEGEDTGTGGPFIPLLGMDAGDGGERNGASEIGIDLFERQMAQWEQLQEVVRSLPLVAPMEHYRLTSRFGRRKDPINSKMARHDGIDLSGPVRSPIYASAPGKVVYAGWKGRLGRAIEIDHGNGIVTRYGHLRRIHVKSGQKVMFGQKIGQLGSSGRSTGPHVHYEILVHGKAVDPGKFIKAGRDVFKG